jgi:hypothetical protein
MNNDNIFHLKQPEENASDTLTGLLKRSQRTVLM